MSITASRARWCGMPFPDAAAIEPLAPIRRQNEATGRAVPAVRPRFRLVWCHQVARIRRLIGFVKSDKMDKTVVVEVTRYRMDPMYKKYVKVRKRYKAHDEANEYRIGDRVEIAEHRPLSKEKRFIVSKLIERPALAG